MKKKDLLFSLLGLFLLSGYAYFLQGCNTSSLEERQILKIAEDTAIKRYGYDAIVKELPLNAELRNDSIWVVRGTLENGAKGGTVYIEISRKDKLVREVTHYK